MSMRVRERQPVYIFTFIALVVAMLGLVIPILADSSAPSVGTEPIGTCPADLDAQLKAEMSATPAPKREMPLTGAERDESVQFAQADARRTEKAREVVLASEAVGDCTVGLVASEQGVVPHPVFGDALVEYIPGCSVGLLEPVQSEPYVIGRAAYSDGLAEYIPGCSAGLLEPVGKDDCAGGETSTSSCP